jgi:hypothetical protein
MSKTKAANKIETVAVRYDLFDLPTAQHKAGLAGLNHPARFSCKGK